MLREMRMGINKVKCDRCGIVFIPNRDGRYCDDCFEGILRLKFRELSVEDGIAKRKFNNNDKEVKT